MKFLDKLKLFQKAENNKFGPIGFDLAIERLNLLQMEQKHNDLKIRTAASIKIPKKRDELLASPGEFCAVVRKALHTKPFMGKKVVSRMPASKIQIINLSYKLSSGQDEKEAIVKEIQDRFDTITDDYVMDYVPIHSEIKSSDERKAVVAIGKRKEIISYLELLKKAGLKVLALDIGPMALRRLVISLDSEKKYPTVLLVNFARARSYLTVLSGRRLIINREAGFGEDMLVARLSKELQTDQVHAYNLLYKYGFGNDLEESPPESVTVNKYEIVQSIREILKPLFLKLAEEVNKVLIYTASETHGRSIEQIYLLGSVARYPGAAPLISDILAIPSKVLNPFSRFATVNSNSILDNSSPIASIATATGMALSGFF